MASTEVLRTDESWIQQTPTICGGDACIRNTRIPVWSVVAARRRAASDQDVLTYFITPLTAADLAAAWAYYKLHTEEIDRDIKRNEEA